MMSNATTKRLTMNLLIFSTAMLLGTIGFSLLENYSLPDSIYFTIATVATVGYADMAAVTAADLPLVGLQRKFAAGLPISLLAGGSHQSF